MSSRCIVEKKAATVKSKNKYWAVWVAYEQVVGVDPYLPEDDSLYLEQIGALAGFSAQVKSGYYGYSCEIQSGSVSTALAAVGQEISMVRRYNPLKMNGSDNLLKPLGIIMSGYKKWDKPVEKKQPVGIDIPELLCTLGQLWSASVKDSILGDWCLIAFYYLLRVGEYTQKNSCRETKQTIEFRVIDVMFFSKGVDDRIRQLPLTASREKILNAVGATLWLGNQKNGWKNVCVFHHANGDEICCPVKALGRLYVHIQAHTKSPTEKLSAYFVKGKWLFLRDKDVSAGLKGASVKLDYEYKRGIPEEAIDTHSLRAGGANAPHLNCYYDREIQKMGRWTSDTFKEYIRENLSIFSDAMSKAMKTDFQFVNVHSGAVKDVTESTIESAYQAAACVLHGGP